MPARISPSCGRLARRARGQPWRGSSASGEDEMFALVADVERYPEFVPLCQALKIRQRRQNPDGTETIVADMTVSFKLVKETFTSEVTLDRGERKINVRYLRGQFFHHANRSTFEP